MGKLSDAKKASAEATKPQDAGCSTHKCQNVICNKTVPPAPPGIIGTCDYYKWREANFRERHVGCGHVPPVYYLNYGYKYCVRFSTQLYPKLSPYGQTWLANARRLLQVYMEEGLQRNMAVELDSDKFQKFAFDTHPDAYWNAGFADLPWGDKINVAKTPDWAELKSRGTWKQAGDIGLRQAGYWAKEAAEAQKAIAKDIVDFFRSLWE